MNELINLHLSHAHEDKEWLPWRKEDITGATMQPQSCYVWQGLEVCGCTRGYKAGQLVNGLIYIIKSFDHTGATLVMHPDYNKDHLEKVKYFPPLLDQIKPKMLEVLQSLENGSTLDEVNAIIGGDEEEPVNLLELGFWVEKKGRGRNMKDLLKAYHHYHAWAQHPERPLTLPAHMVDPESVLSWENFQFQARLIHALPYVYYQGKTVANKTLWLMNVKSPHFTMRHLIMGLGRVQESKRVKILDPEREKRMVLPAAREVFDQYNKWALERKKEEEEAARLLAAADEAVNADDADVAAAALSDDEEEAGFHGDCFEDLELDD
jgi:hypothetical protein